MGGVGTGGGATEVPVPLPRTVGTELVDVAASVGSGAPVVSVTTGTLANGSGSTTFLAVFGAATAFPLIETGLLVAGDAVEFPLIETGCPPVA
ncbi:MAG TPA: hypothetical protein VNC40_08690 [Gaiellaceae bacterium]|nr:hypothetical protein [Gaiellaceae bacterium]